MGDVCESQTEANEKPRFQVSECFYFSLLFIDLTVLLRVAFAFSSDSLRPNGITSLEAKKHIGKFMSQLKGQCF